MLGVAGFWMTRESDKAIIDGVPFRLQYRWTTTLIFVSSVLTSLAELIGKYSTIWHCLISFTSSYNGVLVRPNIYLTTACFTYRVVHQGLHVILT